MIKVEQNPRYCTTDYFPVKCFQQSLPQQPSPLFNNPRKQSSRLNFPKYYYCGITEGKGKWTYKEQKQYISFLLNNFEAMSIKYKRKSMKVFRQMSAQMQSRTPNQCRSHHQKVLKCHKTLEEAIRYYSKQVFYRHEKPLQFYHIELLGGNFFRITINTHQIANFSPT